MRITVNMYKTFHGREVILTASHLEEDERLKILKKIVDFANTLEEIKKKL